MIGPTRKTSWRGVSSPTSRRETTSSWPTMRRSRSACWAIVSRSMRAAVSTGSGPAAPGQGANAGQRRLEVMRDAPQEVGLHRRHPVQLIGLHAQAGVQQRVLDGGGRVLTEQAEQIQLRGVRVRAPFPRSKQDGTQCVAGRHVGDGKRRPPGAARQPRSPRIGPDPQKSRPSRAPRRGFWGRIRDPARRRPGSRSRGSGTRSTAMSQVGSPVTCRAPATMAWATAGASRAIGADRTSAARSEICRLRSSRVLASRRWTPDNPSSPVASPSSLLDPTPRSASSTIERASPVSERDATTETTAAQTAAAPTAINSAVPLPRRAIHAGSANVSRAKATRGGKPTASRTASRRSEGRPAPNLLLRRCAAGLGHRDQSIADTPLGEQEAGPIRVAFHLPAQAPDVHPHI